MKFVIPNQTKLNFFEDKINNFDIEVKAKNLIKSSSAIKINKGNICEFPLSTKNKILKNNNIENETSNTDSNLNSGDEKSNDSLDENHYNDFIKEYKVFYNDKQKNFLITPPNYNSKNPSSFKEKEEDSEIAFLLSKANSLYLSYNLDDSIKVLHEIIRLDPNIQEVYNLLSLIYEEKKDLKNSIYFLMIAAHLSQSDSEIWIKCFSLNKQINNFPQAEYCISRAVKVEKDNPYYLYEKAIINEELNNFKKAANTYKKLLEISDSNSDILVHTANIYEKVLNNNSKAISLLKSHFFTTSKKLMILNKLFNLYSEYSLFEEIVQFYEKNYTHEDENIKKSFDNFAIQIIIKIAYLGIKENIILNKSAEVRTNYNFINKKIEEEIFGYFKELLMNDYKVSIIDKNFINNSCHVFRISKVQFQKFFNKVFDIYKDNNDLYNFIILFELLENDIYTDYNIKSFFKEFCLSKENKILYELELYIENFVFISEYFSKTKNYEKSIEYLNRAIFFSKLKDKEDNVYLILKLSEILNLKGDFKKSMEILDKTNLGKNKKNSNIDLYHNLVNLNKNIENNGISYIEEYSNLGNIYNNTFNLNKNNNFTDHNSGFYKNGINEENNYDFNKNDILEEQENCEKNYLANLIYNQENSLAENYESENEIQVDITNNYYNTNKISKIKYFDYNF